MFILCLISAEVCLARVADHDLAALTVVYIVCDDQCIFYVCSQPHFSWQSEWWMLPSATTVLGTVQYIVRQYHGGT